MSLETIGSRAGLIAAAATCATELAISPSFALIRAGAGGMEGKAEKAGTATDVALGASAVDKLATWLRTVLMILSPVTNRTAALEVPGFDDFEAMML